MRAGKVLKKCRPSAGEIAANKRSKSAILRVIERV